MDELECESDPPHIIKWEVFFFFFFLNKNDSIYNDSFAIKKPTTVDIPLRN